MGRTFDIIIERDSDGLLVASVPALSGCHSQATDRDQLMHRFREAIALHLEEHGEPDEVLEFISVERITLAA